MLYFKQKHWIIVNILLIYSQAYHCLSVKNLRLNEMKSDKKNVFPTNRNSNWLFCQTSWYYISSRTLVVDHRNYQEILYFYTMNLESLKKIIFTVFCSLLKHGISSMEELLFKLLHFFTLKKVLRIIRFANFRCHCKHFFIN